MACADKDSRFGAMARAHGLRCRWFPPSLGVDDARLCSSTFAQRLLPCLRRLGQCIRAVPW